jgi:SagB-type dehydrogenase family enzyme
MLVSASEEPSTLNNRDIEASRVYHDVTKHSYTSVRVGGFFLDWDNKPLPYKIYPDAAAFALPRNLVLPRMPALAAISSQQPERTDTKLDLESLTRILFCAGGITRMRRAGGENYHFRAAASAGALYPIEIYLAAADVDGLEAGLYHFSPADLKLRGLRRGDWRPVIVRATAMRPAIREARAILIMTAIFWRSAWKYRARAYRYCFWDSGTILANLLASARAEDVPAEVVTAFVDLEIEKLVGIDGEREGVACLVALGKTALSMGEPQEIVPLTLETVPLSQSEVTYDDIVKIHRASRLESADEVRNTASAKVEIPASPAAVATVRPKPLDFDQGMPLGETILKRGSTRAFAREPISSGELATILAASSAHPPADFPRLTDTYLIVNAVDGLESGAYYYRRETGAFELLKAGDFRGEAGYLCLEQPLGADCSTLFVYMADLEGVLRVLGNRAYRDAHLEAGILGGRAYLAAYSLGRGATGLTFYDDDTTKFFERHAGGKSPLLMIAMGVPRSQVSGS